MMRHSKLTFTLTTFTALFALSGCETGDTQELDESRSFDLRGGVTITLAEGTQFDADELDSREGYGATLRDSSEQPWFVHVEHVDTPTLDESGLTSFDWETSVGHLGIAPGDGEDDDRCLVLLPVEDETYVLLSRPQGEIDCPTAIDEIADWLPTVVANGEEGFLRAFGDVVGTFNGITAYSNGSVNYNSGVYSTVGLKWQCVEYVNRYFYQKLAHKNLIHTGNAKDYYGTAASKDLNAYANGGGTAPAVGDMLVSNGGSFGHIAIIREVGANYVKVIQQNWSNAAADNSMQLAMTVSNGTYSVAGFPGSYPVQGWLRRKPVCMPTINSVTPTTATLNQSKQFTASGNCLSTTTTAAWIDQCANLVVNSRTNNSIVFTCTPSFAAGIKAGVIKHNTDGTVLRNFSVTVN